ncbi:MAG: hypothetical protein SV583_09430 [Pseudomonadota bacterium]|nr:hypothetical protein [Pseudomonadota bacterium]
MTRPPQARHTHPERVQLRRFALGAAVFFLGGGLFLAGNRYLEGASARDIVTGIGALLLGLGGAFAGWQYVLLASGRILRLLRERDRG